MCAIPFYFRNFIPEVGDGYTPGAADFMSTMPTRAPLHLGKGCSDTVGSITHCKHLLCGKIGCLR